ncbi:hypothetical protein RJ639_030144 [Escallonia herrerae]|uniref:Uncharacterized protein n=1 Tax=Escallonia herrerae TaxID=1293975 RepID=A0AA88WZS0_9ASTE|nr:hypothetical protein RJ639_030144 [Escallonia herrerae]
MASDLETKAKEAFIDDHFELAVDLYSQAIAMSPNAELFADRAQANIKKLLLMQTEQSSWMLLWLKHIYVKGENLCPYSNCVLAHKLWLKVGPVKIKLTWGILTIFTKMEFQKEHCVS